MSKEVKFVYKVTESRFEEFKFNSSITNDVIEFILEYSSIIRQQNNCMDSDLIVCIPKYVQDYLIIEHLDKSSLENGLFFICGIKCQISFDNTVTIFYNAIIPSKIIKYTKQL
ncbi:hypothetical protein [uncultured Empedobacter sp.]|uniref:hypothetical protein n=1 Tax=uncultured Empedobacter sp. TaxID=410844 RepID=UPI0025FF5296|nr:hypothetical protein [uncultured Empedobacter sp.]